MLKCSQCERSLPKSMMDVVTSGENVCVICSAFVKPQAEINELKRKIDSLTEEVKSLRNY